MHRLTPRQMDVLRELMSGDTNKAIAKRLNLTEGTVKMMLHLIYEKTDARNRTQLAMMNKDLYVATKKLYIRMGGKL